MDIDQQIQALIQDAPQDGATPAAVEAIAPILKLVAAQLKHLQYYVLQNLDQQWVVNTLTNRNQPDVSKHVVYAFPTLKDANLGPVSLKDPQLMAIPLPVTHILFQMLAMRSVDSIVFYEVPGNARSATEITRQTFQELIQFQLNQSVQPPPSNLA